LLKLEEYVEFFEIFKDAAREVSFEVNALNSKSDTIVKWLEENKLESIDILPILDLPKPSEEDEKTLRQLQSDFEKISEKNKKIIDNNFIKEQLADLEKQGHLEPVGEEISLTAMLQQQGTFGSKVAEAQAHLDKLSELHGQCPTCEQEVDDEKVEELNQVYFNQKTIAENETELLKGKIAEAKEHNKLVVIQKNQQRQKEDYIRDLDGSLPSTILDGDEISASIDELSSKLRNIHSEINRISEENMKAERHNTRISIIQEQSDGMESQLEELVAALGKVEEKSAHLEILKKAFSTNGLLAYKIENLVKDLEDLTNEYLSELSDGRFSLEFVVTNDKLNVEITDNAKIVDILALSSGELARVNTATLLAIRKLMSSISSSRINTLFLDEIISVLDDEGKEKLVEILLGEELNTYLVSHGWTHPLLAKIEVIKEENISRLE
jgi:DNA repair exonuclease SbcCD ATPase subunit